MRLRTFFLLLIALVGVSHAFAQYDTSQPPPTDPTGRALYEDQKRRLAQARLDDLGRGNNNSGLSGLPPISESTRQRLIVAKEDEEKFAAFLKQSKTGIFKLFNTFDMTCSPAEAKVANNGVCAFWASSGFGRAYSFRQRTHEITYKSDFEIAKDTIMVRGANTLGYLASLGNVELDAVNDKTDAVQSVSKVTVPTNVEEIVKVESQLTKGLTVQGVTFAKYARVAENTTYLLRAIAYNAPLFLNNGKINILENDKRQDIIVAFRVIRKDADGGVTFIWKEMSRKNAPRLVMPK